MGITTRDYAKRIRDHYLKLLEPTQAGPYWYLDDDKSQLLFLAELVLSTPETPEFLPTPGPDIKSKEKVEDVKPTYDSGGSPGTYEPIAPGGIVLQSRRPGGDPGKVGPGKRGK